MVYGRFNSECRNRCRNGMSNRQNLATGTCCKQDLFTGGPVNNCPACLSTNCPITVCAVCADCPFSTGNNGGTNGRNQNCVDNCVRDRRRERRDRPFPNKLVELPLLPFRLLEAESLSEVLEIIEDEFPGGTTGAAATAGITSLAGVAPAPLPMFPPSGLPQPQGFQPGTFNLAQSTTSLIGGGALPSAALTVNAENNIYINDDIDR